MGALQYAVGSHKLGLFDLREHNNEFDLPSTAAHIDREVARLGLEVATIELGPGDVIVHHGLALHRSGPNQSNVARQAVTWFVYPDGAKVARPRYPAHDRERRVYFPGLLPGAKAETFLNPVL